MTEAPAGDGGGLFLDVPKALAAALADRFNFYKLRAKVLIEDLCRLSPWQRSGKETPSRNMDYAIAIHACRRWVGVLSAAPLVAEAAADIGASLVSASAYESYRVGLGIPCGGVDFIYGDTFPHEADMDQLHGVDFTKGCFVGQEVVSRMQHRNTVRTRVIPVAFNGFAPDPGASITAAGKPVGTFGSSANGRALAMLRLDRVEDALASGHGIEAGAATLHLIKPDWARFRFPGERGDA